MNTTENNKIIAEFIGWKEQEEDFMFNPKTNGSIYIKSLLFHKDWNWLMEVVEKIKPLVSESEFKYRIGKHLLNLNIEAVYNACVEFIKWYNEKSAKNN